MVNCPEFDNLWRVVFLKLASVTPSLCTESLGLAGLHLALVNPEQSSHFLLVSAKHYGEALRGYREGIQHMSDKNSDALFAFSILNMLYVMAKNGPAFRSDDEDFSITARRSRIPGFDWISMMRGVEAVLHPVYDYVRLRPLRPLLGVEGFDVLDPDCEKAPGDEHFRRLRELWAGSTDAEVYDGTLHLLRKSHALMMRYAAPGTAVRNDGAYNRAWSAPTIWLHYAPEEYFGLLRQLQPVALILFDFFGALLHSLDGHWFLAGWGRRITDSVDEFLGDFWKPWTEWPRSIVNSK